ncbi:YqjK-like family protein [Billgrantia gudaonensis]|uniref:YqjK-like protein n=1 Tax=Billgrantia gudaonensis TaxID=376427 RepID=A0A1G8MZ70_9GAMM|nr:YqjK-like family protein [Halomonas gudaonensis]SDI73155.1 YqjK-like protein [Halomonas gudaonensis]
MTTRLPAEPSSRHPAVSRADRKAQLIDTIERQRIDILVEAHRWREASRPLDEGWHHLMRFKTAFIAAGGVALYQGARHPHSLIRLARRGLAGALLVNRARRLLRLVR